MKLRGVAQDFPKVPVSEQCIAVFRVAFWQKCCKDLELVSFGGDRTEAGVLCGGINQSQHSRKC